MTVGLTRAYEDPENGDGMRILVDRIWPRGVSKEALRIDEWIKDLAPSSELRRWFGHDPQKFPEFENRYREELSKGPAREAMERLRSLHAEHDLTLVYAAKDVDHNNAVVLAGILQEESGGSASD